MLHMPQEVYDEDMIKFSIQRARESLSLVGRYRRGLCGRQFVLISCARKKSKITIEEIGRKKVSALRRFVDDDDDDDDEHT